MVSLKLFILFIISTLAFGTTYIPTPIDRQVESSSGVVMGIYQGESYKKLKSGEVVTEIGIKVLEKAGVSSNDLLNREYFKIYYPGGIWHNKVYRIDGAPKFVKGEKVLLLIKKTGAGYVLHNFGLGKYTFYEKNRNLYFKSSVFSDHSKLGKISRSYFDQILKNKFGEGLSGPLGNKEIVTKIKTGSDRRNRSIASVGDDHLEEGDGSSEGSVFLWPAAILLLLGIFSIKLGKKNRA